MSDKEYPKRVGEILTELGEKPTGPDGALWQHKQSKKWLVTHKALERVAASQGVTFDDPKLITVDLTHGKTGYAAVWVRGHLGDKSEWSYGEASDNNCQNKYPLAMAEKRAKDRVILKLVGLHGYIYSEDEMEDSEQNPLDRSGKTEQEQAEPEDTPPPKKQAARKRAPAKAPAKQKPKPPVPDTNLADVLGWVGSGKRSMEQCQKWFESQGWAPTQEQSNKIKQAQDAWDQAGAQ